MFSKPVLRLLVLAFFFSPLFVVGQSVSELEARLNRSQSRSEKMNLSYQIAEKSLASNPGKAADFAHRASLLASELGEKRREVESIYLSAEGLFRKRDYKGASGRFEWAWNSAKNYGLKDMALLSTEKLQEVARKQSDMKEELKWSKETVYYLKENSGRSAAGGDAQRKIEAQLQLAEADNRRLREEIAKATGQSLNLESTYKETEAQLKTIQEKTQAEIAKKDETITKVVQKQMTSDSMLRHKASIIESMSAEQMADAMLIAEATSALEAEKSQRISAELATQQSTNFRNVMGLLSLFVLVLAVLFYIRYRSQRRMSRQLTQNNAALEEEQRKSDNLLLNILPPAIAKELKANNKVAARKYDQATVMFVDFTGFTHVAERLTPEALVEELDYCFSNFDRIISKYRIEKIKTVGDAYICASGLSDMNASPSDMVKAALEIQDFLLHLKAERQSQGLPYFEARCGIHTGPVVAGVVGSKKFAYDIWGDTVNTAARMEETSEAGRVNVSEYTYSLAKYEYEWQHRGQVAAKNKGMMDMYYVLSAKSGY